MFVIIEGYRSSRLIEQLNRLSWLVRFVMFTLLVLNVKRNYICFHYPWPYNSLQKDRTSTFKVQYCFELPKICFEIDTLKSLICKSIMLKNDLELFLCLETFNFISKQVINAVFIWYMYDKNKGIDLIMMSITLIFNTLMLCSLETLVPDLL